MDRRMLLSGALALSLAGGATARGAAPAKAPLITTDYAPLRRVMVHEPSEHDYVVALDDRNLTPEPWALPPDAIAQHREFQALLTASGAEVLKLEDLLQTAVDAAKSKGVFATWLRALYPRLGGDPDAVTAATLLGRDPKVQFQRWPDGSYRHVADGTAGMIFSRDATIQTPGGLIISRLSNPSRVLEPFISRFLADFAPAFANYPVVFDGMQEGLFVEGGDIQVVDEKTLFIGVGNRSDPRVAPLLAARLNMDVLAVHTRKADALRGWTGADSLRSMLLHLDTVFTHVGRKNGLALPWFLEKEASGKDPLTAFVKGFGANPQFEDGDVEKAVSYLADFGKVTRYEAGSGKVDKLPEGMKLVDYVRKQGYDMTFVGGEPPAKPDFEYLVEVVLKEHRFQAANVVATAPDKVIAYKGADRTHAALRAAGVEVSTFNAREIWPWNGGPHCLTLPLERG